MHEAAAPLATIWRFDDLRRIGGAPVRVEGDPQIVRTDAGPAVRFDGADDALFIESHPLAGARQFTVEAVFRPDGGEFAQRWLHLAEQTADAPEGAYPPVPPSGPRMLFEIRVVGTSWYLDAFTTGPGYNKALIVPEKTFPVGRWYHVAQVYDGRTYRSYVDGVLQAEADIAFQPQGAGYASLGTRINRRDYFNGAVLSARFTAAALTPDQFTRELPAQ
ncbi:LamG domain-containing protein [Croceibacterium sp. TMG7-5b_MA50]|uniref:LamG domain-containing protein n=1 Tax=Croceibacterium sp. TMG7-5b_MA50 TaxID=3121290 RepID=UPI0032215127